MRGNSSGHGRDVGSASVPIRTAAPGGVGRANRKLQSIAQERTHLLMLHTTSKAGCHYPAGAGDRSSSRTARRCANSRAVRSNRNFAALMHRVLSSLTLDASANGSGFRSPLLFGSSRWRSRTPMHLRHSSRLGAAHQRGSMSSSSYRQEQPSRDPRRAFS